MNPHSIQMSDPVKFEQQLRSSIMERSDKLIERFLLVYFVSGLAFALFYDTWIIAISVGGSNLTLYFITKRIFPNTAVHHYVASLVVGIFMAQFIYQMHGLFEMHFFAFIGSALMITYQNWKVQIPITMFVVIHHAVFGYWQYQSFLSDVPTAVYFTQLNYMDLQTFIIHGILASTVFFICGLWASDMDTRTQQVIENTKNIIVVANTNDSVARNLEHALMLSSGVYTEKIEYSEGDLMGEALSTIQKKLTVIH